MLKIETNCHSGQQYNLLVEHLSSSSSGCHQHNDTFNRNYTSNRDSHIPIYKVNIHMNFFDVVQRSLPISFPHEIVSYSHQKFSDILSWQNLISRASMQVELYKYLRATAYKMRTHFSQDLRAADASDDDTRCTFFVVCLVHQPQIIKMMLGKIEFQCKLTTRYQVGRTNGSWPINVQRSTRPIFNAKMHVWANYLTKSWSDYATLPGNFIFRPSVLAREFRSKIR